ncbi:MAG: hypothetical protein ACRD2N_24865 [Vicinamibacterales bacterium]
MNRVRAIVGISLLAVAGLTSDASAQYRPAGPPTVGDAYHIEAAYGWWNAEPQLIINSEALGIIGSDIDLIQDLGIAKKRLRKFNLTLRPGTKHKFRFEYVPITYEADTVLRRSFVFNGQQYNVGLPVQTVAQFKTSRFGYEYDFLYMKRGFAGVLLDVKYTDVNVELRSPLRSQPEFTKAVAPIPTIGFVGRGYVAPNVSITGELSFFRVPDNVSDEFDGSYTDFDLYSTFNFNRYVGAQVGFRTVSVSYLVDLDQGELKFKGLYFGGVIRY